MKQFFFFGIIAIAIMAFGTYAGHLWWALLTVFFVGLVWAIEYYQRQVRSLKKEIPNILGTLPPDEWHTHFEIIKLVEAERARRRYGDRPPPSIYLGPGVTAVFDAVDALLVDKRIERLVPQAGQSAESQFRLCRAKLA